MGHGLKFHMAAANGAQNPVFKHRHPRAHLARRGALGVFYRHKTGRCPTKTFQELVQKCH